MGWIGGLVGEKTCVSTEVPCPNIEATALLVEYDASQKVKRNLHETELNSVKTRHFVPSV